MKRLFTLLLVFIVPSLSLGITGYPGINMSFSAYHGSTNTNDSDTGSSTTSKNTNLTFGLGTTHSEGMYLGTIYDLTMKNDGNGNLQDSNIGVSVGFSDKGCYLLYHYFFTSNYHLDATTKYQGTGMGFDMGYQVSLGKGFSLGGQISYKKMNFKERIINGEEIGTDYSRENILPSFIFGFSF